MHAKHETMPICLDLHGTAHVNVCSDRGVIIYIPRKDLANSEATEAVREETKESAPLQPSECGVTSFRTSPAACMYI